MGEVVTVAGTTESGVPASPSDNPCWCLAPGVGALALGPWLALAAVLAAGAALILGRRRRPPRPPPALPVPPAPRRDGPDTLTAELLNASSDACMLFDLSGTMLACNQVFSKRFGISPDQVAGTNLWSYFPPEVATQRRQVVAEVAAIGSPQVLVDVRDGRHLSNSSYPLRDETGVVRRIAVYSRDITDQVVAEQRIRDYVAEIERSNEDLEQFAYVASHDLREPLRQVASFVALLERRNGPRLDDPAREFISFARDGAARMDRLILDLLDYSRVGRGDSLAAIDPLVALGLALSNLQGVIADTGAEITLPDAAPPVLGAEPQLVRLFQNLVGNALKYRRPDAPPRIEVSVQPCTGGLALFVVADNGIGIPPDQCDRIFGIFQRLHSREAYDGTGIGLAICRKVVERHGGRIWAEAVPDQGARFLFTLRRSDAK